jgi:hypothetical protein
MQKFNSYKELIDFARSEYRYKGDGTYYELHHIIPRCCGGTNAKSNIVLLTLSEHLQSHYLLAVENKLDIVFYNKMLNSCLIIIHPKSYIKKDKLAAVEDLLKDEEALKFYENIKKQNAEFYKSHPGPNKGKTFYFEHFWIQLNNQKPVGVAEKRLQSELARGAVQIKDCPICHKPNSREDWCCCAEHHEQFEKERKELQSKVNSEKAKNTWKGDNTERLRKIGEANKVALKGKHWMNKDGISKQFAPEDIEKAILEGWKRGRIMPNNPVLSRWRRS